MVASYTQLLARRYQGQLDSDADEFIGFAVDGVNRMQRLIDDLLAYSRAGTAEYRFGPVDVGELVRDTLVGMRTTVAESGATVAAGELPDVWGDEGQLRQLFQNLIGNGIKFRAEDPPRVEVTAERQGAAGCSACRTTASGSIRATPSASSASSSACTAATSTRGAASGSRSASGSWSATTAVSRSSEPCRREQLLLHDPGPRSSAGPAIRGERRGDGELPKRMSDHHRRRASRQQPKDGPMGFRVLQEGRMAIPQEIAPPLDAERAGVPGARRLSANGIDGTVEILLVEDNPADARLTREVFEGGRLSTHLNVVADGEQALAFLRREGAYAEAPRPKLVLLDLNLPRKDGREVLDELKSDADAVAASR